MLHPKKAAGSYQQSETYTDGLLRLMISQDFIITGTYPESFLFGNRTIGVKRFWEARAQGAEISKLVSIPLYGLSDTYFNAGDIVEVIDYTHNSSPCFYKIEQVQVKSDVMPASIYLSLSSNEIHVTDARGQDDG
ncbi:MAG: hypothetical protein HDR44_02340 [Allobaculum sp.]|nr:hypothetical protein [Allobaculum sp.]